MLTETIGTGSPLKLLLTSEAPPAADATGCAVRRLRGITRSGARALLAASSAGSAGPTMEEALFSEGEEVSPWYVEELLALEAGAWATAGGLVDLIDAKIQSLDPAQRRVMQVVAVTGGGALEEVRAVIEAPEDLEEALLPLVSARLVEVGDGIVRVAHRLVSERVLTAAPAGTLADLHARAAAAALARNAPVEISAFHAVRGQPGFAAFLLVEEAARLNGLLADDDAGIELLLAGFEAARTQNLRGDLAASSAERVFVTKLGTALLNAGRAEEAAAVLERAVASGQEDGAAQRAADRVLVLAQLALALSLTGRAAEAERRRAQALELASASGDPSLRQQIEGVPRRFGSQTSTRAKRLYPTPYCASAPSLASLAKRAIEAPRARKVTLRRDGDGGRRDPRREEEDDGSEIAVEVVSKRAGGPGPRRS
jgi:tetratricopeptide (TPR) repeat protein